MSLIRTCTARSPTTITHFLPYVGFAPLPVQGSEFPFECQPNGQAFEVGILGSFFERALDKWVYGNERALDGWIGMFSRGMVPVDPRNPYNFFGSGKSVAEISANWDSFRETTITPHWDDDKM